MCKWVWVCEGPARRWLAHQGGARCTQSRAGPVPPAAHLGERLPQQRLGQHVAQAARVVVGPQRRGLGLLPALDQRLGGGRAQLRLRADQPPAAARRRGHVHRRQRLLRRLRAAAAPQRQRHARQQRRARAQREQRLARVALRRGGGGQRHALQRALQLVERAVEGLLRRQPVAAALLVQLQQRLHARVLKVRHQRGAGRRVRGVAEQREGDLGAGRGRQRLQVSARWHAPGWALRARRVAGVLAGRARGSGSGVCARGPHLAEPQLHEEAQPGQQVVLRRAAGLDERQRLRRGRDRGAAARHVARGLEAQAGARGHAASAAGAGEGAGEGAARQRGAGLGAPSRTGHSSGRRLAPGQSSALARTSQRRTAGPARRPRCPAAPRTRRAPPRRRRWRAAAAGCWRRS